MRRTVHCAKDLRPKKDETKPYRVERNETFGRYLVANKDLREGEIILKESFFVVGPQIKTSPLCSKCYTPLLSLPKIFCCPKCKVAPVCNLECRGNGHFPQECIYFIENTSITMKTLLGNPQILTYLRCLIMKQHFPEKWTFFMEMEPHMDERRGTDIWKTHEMNAERVLCTLQGVLTEEDVNQELVQKICGILDVNSFELRSNKQQEEGSLRGVFLEASLMAHDCLANTHLAIDENYALAIRAAAAIPAGKAIFFNYTKSLVGTQERQNHLQNGKYFTCNCLRCSDPTELGTNLSSLCCTKCSKGFLIPLEPLKQQFSKESVWVCKECSGKKTGRDIYETIGTAEGMMKEFGNLREGEKCLEKLLKILHPQHYIILELKQTLIGFISEEIRRENVGRKLLRRKFELCQDILNVLDKIEPKISRLKGIALYEMHVPKVVLANKEYESKEITAQELLEQLMWCETALKTSVSTLIFEPKQSPEGILCLQALQELKLLRDTLSGVKNIAEAEKTRPKQKHVRK